MSVNYNRFGQSTGEMDGASATMSVCDVPNLPRCKHRRQPVLLCSLWSVRIHFSTSKEYEK